MYISDEFAREIAEMLNETVTIETTGGGKLTGKLKAIDPKTLSVVLEDVLIEGETFKKLVISGETISCIYLKEKRIDLEKLKEVLERYFPRLVEYRKDIGVIVVMNRVRVTDKGVEGPPGPATERVRKIFEDFLKAST